MKSEMQVRGKKPFELAIERVGDQLSVSCDGRLIHRHTVTDTGSPGMLKRLSDGSLVLLYNAIPTKGYERREELFVSFSEDEGESWTKPFVVARNAGACVAYAYIDEPVPGELWISSMQGGLRARTTLAELKSAAKGCP